MSKPPVRRRHRHFICYSLYPLGFFLSAWGLFTPLPGTGALALAGAAIVAFITAFCLLDIYRHLDRLRQSPPLPATDASTHPNPKEKLQ